ncbi:uncharacterized protein LOC133726508 [Rosa rugosa]|uniref:uncharacterized protein LOC133726508 n=1 Tax=Rosa rugosa TaxID=74645 RepID=UPI002B4043D0|nr:uncharacterized protein LOC133726508 [Rosa rugosa]
MHGSPAEESIPRRRHMWPVPHSNATTVASNPSSPPPPDFFNKDGRKIRVGDCALFKPPQDSPPFIGIIRWLKLDKGDSLSLGVNWLYRPADVKLLKGVSPEAAPNEVFYSFHKDEIPAASLLHPCKVAFLRKGVELPSGISSFVCRRVYDTENKCLWWLTDKDYINERQEEVDHLLDKTRLEMHGAVQSGGRSPKPLNAPSSTPQFKSGSDSLQNSASPFSSQGKGKKRERGDQSSDPVKRERLIKTEDGEAGHARPESVLKSELSKITDKGGLVDLEAVEKLVQLMQPDSAEKKIDMAGRILLVDVIAVTDRFDCLGRFVQLRGLAVLDEWLQEVHKGKIGDGSSPKESDKSVEEFLFALLRALDKLPVNLHALQTCNVGKSVNNLRTHKNSEIQKKARSLVDTWKKRVEAEMKLNESKSGSSRGVSWPSKAAPSEVSQVGSRKTGSSSEVGSKSSTVQNSVSKSPQVKVGSSEMVSKSSASPGSTKLLSVSSGNISKDQNFRMLVGAGNSDLPLTPIKEERSSSSSQSQNNSQSSDHAKTVGSLYKEDARSSSAGSVSANKLSSGSSRHRKSSNGLHGSAGSGVHKEGGPGKVGTPSRNLTSEKASTAGVSYEKGHEAPMVDQASSRLIVRLPNTGRSPARGASGGSFEDPVTSGRASPSAEKHGNQEKKAKGRSDALLGNSTADMNSDVCHSKDGLSGSEENNVPPFSSEQNRAGEDAEKPMEASKVAGPGSKVISRMGKSYEASLSSMNALIESCVKFSEGSDTASPGDDVGMNLLASVAAGELSKSENVSPSCSPQRNSPVPDGSFSDKDAKLKQLGEVSETQCQPIGRANSGSTAELGNAGDSLRGKSEPRHSVPHLPANVSGGDTKCSSAGSGNQIVECNANLNCSSNMQQNVDRPSLAVDGKLVEPYYASGSELPSCATKEGLVEAEGCNQSHEQGKLGAQNAKGCSISESKLKVPPALHDEDKILHKGDERTVGSSKPIVSEATSGSEKVEKDNETSTCSSSEMADDNPDTVKDSNIALLAEQKPSGATGIQSESKEGKSEDAVPCSGSGNTLQLQLKGENTDEDKAMGHSEQTVKDERDKSTERKDALEHSSEFSQEIKERKETSGHCSGTPIPRVQSPSVPVQENHKPGCKLEAIESGEKEERQISGVNASGSDTAVKLDFDLNEGFPVDDSIQQEFVKAGDPGASSSVHVPCPLPFQMPSMSGSFPASVTVVAPAKGSFVPPENPMRSKGELGWKGSTARSAFRPAEPRKNLEAPLSTSDPPVVDTASSKQGRPPLDFDLNVPDQRVYEDVVSQNPAHVMDHKSGSHDRGAGGLDLDLNRVDESPDIVPLPVINSCRLEIPPLPSRSSLSGGLSNGGINDSRDFDLNNGPGLDEVGTEAAPFTQHIKSSVPLRTPVSGLRMNSPDFGNFSAWFAPGNSYPAITVPSIFPGRGEQSYGTAAGSQRVLCPPTGNPSFGPEIYRGPVLSSSTAVPFPPTTYQYAGFPFETNFPLSSSSFSGCSTAYVDSSSGGALCFPTMPSQLMGPGGVVSSPYPRPYMMNLAGSSSNVGLDGRKWGSQGLDLNSGPGGTEAERRDERLPSGLRQLSVPSSQALVEEQLKMFQVGGVLKRKEPDSGLDAVDRMSYKQPWQQ